MLERHWFRYAFSLLTILACFTGCETTPTYPDRVVTMATATTGAITWTDGITYQGEIQAGLPHGEGIKRWTDGGVYHGSFQRGVLHGDGVYSYGEGGTTTGRWKNGTFVRGSKIFPPGNKFKSKEGVFWNNGNLYEGTVLFNSGEVQEGKFRSAGDIEEGKIRFADGRVRQGKFDNRYLVQGQMFNSEGKLTAEGYWSRKDGKTHGVNIQHNLQNGFLIIEANYNEGVQNGRERIEFEGGTVRANNWKDGKKEGYWVEASPIYPKGKSHKEVTYHENGKSQWAIIVTYPSPHYQGTPTAERLAYTHHPDGKLSYQKSPYPHSLNPNVIYIGSDGNSTGPANGEAPGIFVGGLEAGRLYIRKEQNQQYGIVSFQSSGDGWFSLAKQVHWEAGQVIAAEFGQPTTSSEYYIGEVDDRGRKHGAGRESYTRWDAYTEHFVYDPTLLEPVEHAHGNEISYSSSQVALAQMNTHYNRKSAQRQAAFEAELRAEEEAERREEERARRADAERRARQNEEQQQRAALKNAQWNAAQAQRQRELDQFSRQVDQHNRNLADAYDQVREAQRQQQAEAEQRQREAEERRRAEQLHQAELARARAEAEAARQRAEAERARAEQERIAEEQRRLQAQREAEARALAESQAAAAAAAKKEAAEQAQREAEEQAKQKAVADSVATSGGSTNSSTKVPSALNRSGRTPRPGSVPNTPKGKYSDWVKYAEVVDSQGGTLLRLEYRVKQTTGLGDEPYLQIDWQITNLSRGDLYDVSITDKYYDTDTLTAHYVNGEIFERILAAGERNSNIADTIESTRLKSFQLQNPGIIFRSERGGENQGWESLGSIRYY